MIWMRKRNLITGLLCVMLAGCSGNTASSVISTKEPLAGKAMSGDVYGNYETNVNERKMDSSYTVVIQNSYEMSYSDSTKSIYDMDEVLQETGSGDSYTAHLKQNINSNGLVLELDGYYYGDTLYNTYNGISYYEEMNLSDFRSLVLVPLDPYVFGKEYVSECAGVTAEDGTVTYRITIADDKLSDVFTSRYDKYGLSSYENFVVTQGTITDSFDSEGRFIKEETEFLSTVTVEEQEVNVKFTSSVLYTDVDSTKFEITDEQKKEQSAYVSFEDIDTSSIQTITSDDDSAESTVVATFRKRIVNRLGYTDDGEDRYRLSFNDDNEMYLIDFKNCTFEYGNRTIYYVYSWKTDMGSLSKCTYDFKNDSQGDECQDSTVDMIKEVKNYLSMELYYCGLTLEGLQSETNN